VIPEDPPMDITFACRCGTRVRARREAAGRQYRCPTCCRPLFVPDLGVILRLNPRFQVAGMRPAATPGGTAGVLG